MIEISTTQHTRETILAHLVQLLPCLQKMGVVRLGLFGSYARNEQTPESDVDLLVSMKPFTFVTWMDVWNLLEDKLGMSVDLVPDKDLRDEIRANVMREVVYVSEH